MFDQIKVLPILRTVFLVFAIAGVVLIVLIVAKGQGLLIRNSGTFQVVFLDNDQVYFGKLRSASRELWSLTDVYYLRAGSVQNLGAGSAVEGGEGEMAGQIDLIKLGAELHAPRDEMLINKSHVIFYEDIGEDSEVMKLILEYEAR